ncbi:molybdopterin-dependent oxidoreductase, partial [Candidatus Zixiibacteriota bacterium]
IEAAKKLGIKIPHYCYHPALSIAGSCRLCLVEIEKFPKPAIACHTVATEGMVVHTDSETARQARAAMLEFLLANHPLDCPICDQAGECKLQQYYMTVGQYNSALLDNKVKKTKAKVIGPHVILDSERCILCSRCVRFTDEISKSHELGIFRRGDHSELSNYPGMSLDNPYSANVVDICPVGALTDRDFRFKVRVWYLESAPSICHGCARGCNIRVDYLTRRFHHNDGKRIARFKPRVNPAVNGHWICNAGRYSYKSLENEDRLLNPCVANGSPEKASWTAALARIADAFSTHVAEYGVGSVAVIASASMTNEEMWAARQLFYHGLKIEKIAWLIPPGPHDTDDELLIRADKNANTFGAEKIFGPITRAAEVQQIIDKTAAGRIKAWIVLDRDLAPAYGEVKIKELTGSLKLSFYAGSHLNTTSRGCRFVLPTAVYTEKEGTITNVAGRVQHFPLVVPPLGDSLSMPATLSRLASALGQEKIPSEPAEMYESLGQAIEHFKDKTYAELIEHSAPMKKISS